MNTTIWWKTTSVKLHFPTSQADEDHLNAPLTTDQDAGNYGKLKAQSHHQNLAEKFTYHLADFFLLILMIKIEMYSVVNRKSFEVDKNIVMLQVINYFLS